MNPWFFYGSMFDAFVAHERMQPDDYWADQNTEKDDFSFHGLFNAQNKLVGLQGARTYEGDPSGHTVLWWGSYVRPSARGIGATQALYQSRESWCFERGYKSAKAYVLGACKRSAEILCKRGAKQIGCEFMRFHGGPPALWYWHEIPLVRKPKVFPFPYNLKQKTQLHPLAL